MSWAYDADTVNGLNQYSATYGYDLNGNLTSDGTTSYGYNIENRLASASGQLNGTLSYDPLGRLWQTTGASGRYNISTTVMISPSNDGSNNILRRYLHGPGADEPQIWYEGSDYSQPRWYHQDHQSLVIAITDYSGNRISPAWVTRVLRLAFLPPSTVDAILSGRQPAAMTAHTLLQPKAIGALWQNERASRLGSGLIRATR